MTKRYSLLKSSILCGIYRIVVPTVILVILSGCNPIDPEPPTYIRPTPMPEFTPSLINADCHLAVDQILRLANKKIPQQLFQKSDIDMKMGTRMDLIIQRIGKIKMTGQGNFIHTTIPIKATGNVKWQKSIGITTLKHDFDITASVEILLKTSFRFDENWRLIPKTKSDYRWSQRPVIPLVAGIKIDLGDEAEKEIEKQLKILTPKLDKMISDLVDLPEMIEPVWFKIGMSVPIQKNPPIWLRANPTLVAVSPITIDADTIRFQLGIKSVIESFLGNQPPPRRIFKMPPLTSMPDSLQRCKIYLNTAITYETASTIITERMIGKTINYQDKASIDVGLVGFYANGNFLVISIDFEAEVKRLFVLNDTRGRVYLTGKPVYDPLQQVLRVDSLNYDLNSRNVLANTANWMLSDTFIEYLQDKLSFPMGKRIEKSQTDLQRVLKRLPIGKHVILNGQIATLTPLGIYLDTTEAQIHFLVEGEFQIELNLAGN